MKAINFKESGFLSKPKSTIGEERHSLPIYTNGKQFVSLWKMNFKERITILLFGRIWLSVLGTTHQPFQLNASYTIFKHIRTKKQNDKLKQDVYMTLCLVGFFTVVLLIALFLTRNT